MLEGLLDADSAHSYAQDAVIDDNARKALFPDRTTSPVGRIILVGRVPCRIIGMTRQQQSGFGSSASPTVYLPYTTVQARSSAIYLCAASASGSMRRRRRTLRFA